MANDFKTALAAETVWMDPMSGDNYGEPVQVVRLEYAQELIQTIEAFQKDAERYRRLRENWIDCKELNLHGRLSVVDEIVDAAIEKQRGGV